MDSKFARIDFSMQQLIQPLFYLTQSTSSTLLEPQSQNLWIIIDHWDNREVDCKRYKQSTYQYLYK